MFSLINVHASHGDRVTGTWLQDFTGSKEQAVIKARRTEAVNSNKITVAVTERVAFGLLDGPGDARRIA